MDLSAIDLSSYLALTAAALLALNVLLGLLMSVKYNPVRNWPHRRINTFKLHNWTGYLALGVAAAHPVALLFGHEVTVRLIDLLYPPGFEKQPVINSFGALALYTMTFVVVTSYFRREIGRRRWKPLHYSTYGLAVLFLVHGIPSDPSLKDHAIDYLDGEKVYLEALGLVIIVASILRVRFRKGSARRAGRSGAATR
jgi:predicted ferric reductase